jgi:hypothetical protein
MVETGSTSEEDNYGLTKQQLEELEKKYTPVVLNKMVRKLSNQSIRDRFMKKYSNNFLKIVTMTVDVGINRSVTHQLSFTEASQLANMGRLMEYNQKLRGRGIKIR